MNNEAFIDGQNLIYSSRREKPSWDVDLAKFRFYLERKYNVNKAYYFIGYYDASNIELYKKILNYGYVLVFRKHIKDQRSIKKGNVDTDLVFEVMKKLVEKEDFDKVVLVSGDGDYFKMVEYLINKNKFCKLLAPNEKRMSSLYKLLNRKYYSSLSQKEVINKIGK